MKNNPASAQEMPTDPPTPRRILRLDLHIHSLHSPDGRMSLREIVERAQDAGLDGCAVCDHDRILPAAELAEIRRAFPDFVLIPGIEISTEYGHLLGWFVEQPVETRDFAEAVRAIHAQKGIAVLAHPFEHSRDEGRLVSLVPLLDGVEVWNSRAERKNPQANAMAEAFARAHHLRPFAGSDAHVPREIGHGVTTVPLAEVPQSGEGGGEALRAVTPERVRTALLQGGTETAGVRSRAWDTARSQWTRRRKSGAGLFSYCKWAAFAVKCIIEDCLRFRR